VEEVARSPSLRFPISIVDIKRYARSDKLPLRWKRQERIKSTVTSQRIITDSNNGRDVRMRGGNAPSATR